MIYQTEIAFAILNLLEAALEKYVILMKDPYSANYQHNNKMEHRLSGLYYFAICGIITLQFYQAFGWSLSVPLLLWSLLTSRRLFFDYGLKHFRKRPLKNIEGDQFIDPLVRRLLGAQGGYVEVFLLAATLAFCIILLQRFSL